MTDNTDKTHQRRNPQKGRGNRPSRAEREPVDRNAVPMLRHGTENNFPTHKKKMAIAALEKYHDLGRMIDLGEYYVPEEVDVDLYDLDDDPHGLNLSEYKDARKSRNRNIDRMKSDRAGLFAFMVLHLSNESLDAIKLVDEWTAANDSKDPHLLWRIIEATHRVGIDSRIPAVLKAESRRAYQTCAQSTYESIVTFKERFDDLLANYLEYENPEMLEEDVAMDFYRALDNSRYAAFKTNLVNGVNSGATEQPANLNEMYSQASSYLVPTRQQQAGTHRTVFATTADKSNNSGRQGGGRGRGEGRGRREKGGDESKADVTSDAHANRDCWGCGETGHILRDCPSVPSVEGGETKDGMACTTRLSSHWRDRSDNVPGLTSGSSWCNSEDDDGLSFADSDDPDDYPDMPELISDSESDDEEEEDDCVAYLSGPKTTEWYEVLLDNQANTSVIHPRLLHSIQRTPRPSKVGGLSGHTVSIDLVGHLEGFFDVLAYHDVAANVLCMADVEDLYEITYEPGHSITVHMDEEDMVFYRRNKIYVGDMRKWETYPREPQPAAMVTTVAANEAKLTTKGLKKVQAARGFIKAAGYPTLKEAVRLVQDGNLLECRVTASDIRLAFEVDTESGVYPSMAKGKAVNGHPPRLPTDDSIKMDKPMQQLYTDVMHVMEKKFLITVAEPLHITLCTPVDRETTHELGTALQEHLDTLREKGFNPIRVHCDPQASLAALRGRFPGTEIDVQGAGDHLSIVDAKIKRVKEMVRCIQSDLPWPLPDARIQDLVAYAVSRTNIRRTAASVDSVAPRVAMTGRKIRASRELALAFGDYCEVPDPKVVGVSQKSRQATVNRTNSCIALYPISNEVGSWQFLNLESNATVRRSRWTLMVTPPVVIARMTELSLNKDPAPTTSVKPDAEVDEPATDGTSDRDLPELTVLGPLADSDRDGESHDEQAEDQQQAEDDEPTVYSDNRESPTSDDDLDGEWVEVRRRRRTDTGKAALEAGVLDGAYHVATQRPKGASYPILEEGDPATYNSFHVSARKGLQQFGNAAHQAIVKEFFQLYAEKKALAPVHRRDLTAAQAKGIIRSSLFLNPKHDAMGAFQKIKARLVGNGKQQDKNLWPDRSSPTVALESVMTVLTVAAKQGRKTACLDIGSAYLEAQWEGDPTYIVIEKMLSTIFAHQFPDLKAYKHTDGTLLMRLDKALYGTLMAGKLWYVKLCKILLEKGFKKNPVDPCVMNKTVNGNQITLALFVDDILATCVDEGTLTWIIEELKGEFDDVKGSISDDFSYLGMHVVNDRAARAVHISMEGYEAELMKFAGVTGVRKTPAANHLFTTGSSQKLAPAELEFFHTVVAKLLYLTHRARPQVGVAVAYLTTRVTCGNRDDMSKLERALMYINGTKGNRLTLSCAGELRVFGKVDVAFGSHEDGKCQTAIVRTVGEEATVTAKSQKQKMVAKDSTEGELIGLTDSVDGIMRLDEFLREQGHDMDLPLIYQDNQSTISLVTKGGGKYRSVHLRVRQCRIKEMIDTGKLEVGYMSTGNMVADVLTKPLQGSLFLAMVRKLLNNLSCGGI